MGARLTRRGRAALTRDNRRERRAALIAAFNRAMRDRLNGGRHRHHPGRPDTRYYTGVVAGEVCPIAIGTPLLEQPDAERAALLEALGHRAEGCACATSATWSARSGLARARRGSVGIAKDVAFGEFNVCLDGIRDLPAGRLAVASFGDRLR